MRIAQLQNSRVGLPLRLRRLARRQNAAAMEGGRLLIERPFRTFTSKSPPLDCIHSRRQLLWIFPTKNDVRFLAGLGPLRMTTDRELPSNELPTNSDIESWIRLAKGGSSDAMGTLLQTFRQYMSIIAEHGLQGEMQAKVGRSDVVQETFLEAQRDFESFRGQTREQFEAWLRRLLLNNLLNCRRKFRETQKRACSREVPLESYDSRQPTELASDDTSPSGRAIRNEEAVRLEQAMSNLPEHYQIVIKLRNHQRLSFVEIGKRMDRSPDNARMLWSRAFESLANAVEQLR